MNNAMLYISSFTLIDCYNRIIMYFTKLEANKIMSDELKFFIFLIEQYANYKNEPTGDILRAWEEKNITKTIYENYPHYHTERIENAFEDIDSLMSTGKPAW